MTGIFSVGMQVYSFYFPRIPPRSLFLSCTWIAFVISAFLAWMGEYQNTKFERGEKEKAQKALQTRAPKLFVDYSACVSAALALDLTGLSMKNDGDTAAHNVRITPETRAGLTLHIINPVRSIEKGTPYPLGARFCKLDERGRLLPIGGLPSQQISSLLEALAQKGEDSFTVTIEYEDFERHSFSSRSKLHYDNLFKIISIELC